MRRSRFDPARISAPISEVDFIHALDRVQGDERDVDFAARLGVSLTLWRKTRNGAKALSFRLLAAGADLVSHRVYEAAKVSITERASRRGVAA